MDKIILGIHGLSNKPDVSVLTSWWKNSIAEGLRVNQGMASPEFDFKMVYWADLLYKYAMHDDDAFRFDRLYNAEPYYPAEPEALKEYRTSWFDQIRAGAFDLVGTAIDRLKEQGFTALGDWALGRMLRDLSFYYEDDREIKARDGSFGLARTVLRDELRAALLAEQGKDVLLIAHSMGSIIAYDVLRELGRSHPDMQISQFVTIGSPLGLPHVKAKIVKIYDYDPRVRTPSIVTKSWVNFADKDDPVAADIHLRDDYLENARGIRVEDDLVSNDYRGPESGKANPHKSYGYLRAPELSRHIARFIA